MLLKSMDSKAVTLRLLAVAFAAGLLVLFVAACGGQSGDTHGSRTYLEEVRPACDPVPGSDRDPCERFPTGGEASHARDTGHRFSKPPLPLEPEWRLRSSWGGSGVMTPQIIVRGVGSVNSTRCSEVAAYNFGDGDYSVAPADAAFTMEVCHIDFDVREYIVGTGPSRIPVIVKWYTSVPRTGTEYGTASYFAELASPIGDVYEGSEKILELVQPTNLAWGDWSNAHAWDVQRRSDGSIVGVSGLWRLFDHDVDIGDWEHPLDELQRKLKAAHATVAAEYGGRISDEPDSPMLVADASRESLLAQLRELGAYDVPGITPVPAPPAPDLR